MPYGLDPILFELTAIDPAHTRVEPSRLGRPCTGRSSAWSPPSVESSVPGAGQGYITPGEPMPRSQVYPGLAARVIRLSFLLSIAGRSWAQEVPVWTVTSAKATSDRPFDQVRGAVELSDGRLIVLDDGLFVVNLVRGVAVPIGRYGDGPGEYRAPIRLVALPGDTCEGRIVTGCPTGGPDCPIPFKYLTCGFVE